jgi:hypothetical protein
VSNYLPSEIPKEGDLWVLRDVNDIAPGVWSSLQKLSSGLVLVYEVLPVKYNKDFDLKVLCGDGSTRWWPWSSLRSYFQRVP